jgi:hypothetical protein
MPETVSALTQPRPLSQPDAGGSASQESMEKLMGREQSTNQLLSPSAWLNVKTFAQNTRDQIGQFFGKFRFKPKQSPNRTVPQAPLYVASRDMQKPIRHTQHPSGWLVWLSRVYVGIRSLGMVFKRTGQMLTKMFGGGRKISRTIQHLPTRAADTVDARVSIWKKLNRQRKIALLVAVILIFVLAESMVLVGKQRDKTALAKTYQTAIDVAGQKIDEADAALLYANEDNARNLISQARDQINGIPEKQRQKKYQSEITDLETKLATLNEKVKHAINIPEPTVLTNLADTTTDVSPSEFMGLMSGKLATVTTNQKLLYVTDIASKVTTTVALPDTLASEPVLATTMTAKQGVVLFQDNTILQYDAVTNAITPLKIDFPNQDKTLVSGAFYEIKSSLYVLDTKNNTILRHARSGNTFAKGVNRIDSTANVQNGQAVAIADGIIYLLRNDGSVTNFDNSQFSLTPTDPALTAPTKMYVDETDLIYILDPANKRLVAYTKATGKFKFQYTSDKFDSLIDFTVDPGAKKAYLLNGTIVYVVDLQ